MDFDGDDPLDFEEEMVWEPIPISDEEYQLAVEIIQRRAHQIAEVNWHTLLPIPRNSGFFPADTTIMGVPYSSVKEMDKFVGQEVSFYTFLSAVRNPRSVLYTEDVGEYPYKGTNCAAYYGTVCSMTVNYVLGLGAPYQSGMYADLPFIEKVKQQDPYGAKIGDILWKKGHVVLVEDIVYNDDGTISSVYILESMGSFTKIKRYSLSSFSKRWENSSWVLYRYLDFGRILLQEDIPFLSSTDSENYVITNISDICCNRGDRACYREGEDVFLNVFHQISGNIDLYKDGQFFASHVYKGSDVLLSKLTAGKYEARFLESSTSFEIINTSVSAQKANDGIRVFFNSANGIPEYVVLCDIDGTRNRIHMITDSEKLAGRLWLHSDFRSINVKLFFRGEYGRVSNTPILIR